LNGQTSAHHHAYDRLSGEAPGPPRLLQPLRPFSAAAWRGLPPALRRTNLEDHGGCLAATVTYHALISLVPPLLVSARVPGFVLRGNCHLAQQIAQSLDEP
jgi:hypothetical protein